MSRSDDADSTDDSTQPRPILAGGGGKRAPWDATSREATF